MSAGIATCVAKRVNEREAAMLAALPTLHQQFSQYCPQLSQCRCTHTQPPPRCVLRTLLQGPRLPTLTHSISDLPPQTLTHSISDLRPWSRKKCGLLGSRMCPQSSTFLHSPPPMFKDIHPPPPLTCKGFHSRILLGTPIVPAKRETRDNKRETERKEQKLETRKRK
jgi:hypothetical protein